jgi:hypothetical protein
MSRRPKRKVRRHFYDYVGELARQMWLGSWEITHEWDDFKGDSDSDSTIWALTNPLPEYRRAKITWNPVILDASPRETRDTVVHELLHLHHAHLDKFIEELIAGYSQEAQDINHGRHRNFTEEHTVVMERLIGGSMPMFKPLK